MTQFLRLAETQPKRFIAKYLAAEESADTNREREFAAAVKIQSLWRGYSQRKVMLKWNNAATFIQKMWRGVIARNNYDVIVRESLVEKRRRQFNHVATVIQAAWRGYITRRKVLDFYARKAYLLEVDQRNKAIREEVEEFEREQRRIRDARVAEEKKQKHLKRLERQHHMLSTTSKKGVISHLYGEDAEVTVRAVSRLRNLQNSLTEKYQPKPRFTTLESTLRVPEKLPPVAAQPQGPFLPSETLRRVKSRQKRVALAREEEYTPPVSAKDIFARPEAEGHTFQPFANTSSIQSKKEASIFTHAPFIGDGPSDQRMPYGRTNFRDTLLGNTPAEKTAFSTTVRGVVYFDED